MTPYGRDRGSVRLHRIVFTDSSDHARLESTAMITVSLIYALSLIRRRDFLGRWSRPSCRGGMFAHASAKRVGDAVRGSPESQKGALAQECMGVRHEHNFTNPIGKIAS
jgi:hypothetical protein